MNLFKQLLFRIKTGGDVRMANKDKPVEELVIRYKDYYFMIDLDAETGEPTGDFGWSEGTALTPVLIRDFWVAKQETN